MEKNKKAVSGDSLLKKQISPSSTSVPSSASPEVKGQEIGQVGFKRINADKQKNKKAYFFGLVPAANRETIHAGSLALDVYTQIPEKQRDGKSKMVDKVGMVAHLSDEQAMRAKDAILRTGLRFRGGMSPQKFRIKEKSPSDHHWEANETPLGQWCYFESAEVLDKEFGVGLWRSFDIKMKTLIERDEAMGDPFTFRKSKRKLPRNEYEEEENLVVLSDF